ncbi:hypothetical protein FB446DRAFT_709486 [Lentinula raphanica]|nr:hypothetical protein FB446DRAFT_709486 [Lentinula raphanica]
MVMIIFVSNFHRRASAHTELSLSDQWSLTTVASKISMLQSNDIPDLELRICSGRLEPNSIHGACIASHDSLSTVSIPTQKPTRGAWQVIVFIALLEELAREQHESLSGISALLDALGPIHVAQINPLCSFLLALTNVASMFFQQITRSPPLIIANRPPPFEAVRMLALLKALSSHLSGLPLFQARSIITESRWPRILLWLEALLRPLNEFIRPDYAATERYSDMAGHCVVEVFTFLNCTASAHTSTELDHFIIRLASSSEMLMAIAKAWVAFFTRKWPIEAHYQVTSFLIRFSQMLVGTTLGHSFLVAVRNVCPNSLFTTWSAAIAEVSSLSGVSTAISLIQTANRGLLLASTTTFFQPLPMLDEIHVILAHTHKLWSQILTNGFPPGTRYVTMHSLAKFSLLVISGGPNWITKALDANLLGLLMKTIVWAHTSFSSSPDTSIRDIFEEILRLLLLNTIYKPVQRRIRRNLEGVQARQFEDTLGADALKGVWDHLVNEICSPAARHTSALCFQKALEKCSSDSPGRHSLLCGKCRVTSYCSINCQREHWQAGHKAVCSKLALKQFTHPTNCPHDDSRGPADLDDLNRLQLLFRAVIQAQRYRDEIWHSICKQGLHSSQIVIEVNFMSYPSTLKVLDQASSPELQFYLSNPRTCVQADTVVAVTCPCTARTSVYFARGVHRAILLDPAHDLVYEGFGGQVFCNLDNIFLP